MRHTKTSTVQLVVLGILVVIYMLLAWWLSTTFGGVGRIIATGIALFGVLFLQLEVFNRVRNIRWEQFYHDRQLQAVLNLHTVLKPKAPLPIMRLATLGPDMAIEYLNLIRSRQPKTIVELGSGVSTVIAAILLKEQGGGKVIALDHDKEWLEHTREILERHGVSEYADLRYAPLVPVEGANHPWYDPQALAGVDQVDLLLIDGPPDYKDEGRRQPGLTYLTAKLSSEAVVIADDCDRKKWRNFTMQWSRENGFSTYEPYSNESESLILTRK